MSGTRPRRLVLDLGRLAATSGGLRAAAELGALLDLDMIGIYVEDEALIALGGVAVAREYRLPGRIWDPLDPTRMLREISGIAEHARRRLAEEVGALGRPARFERVRGDPGEAVARQTGPFDILATGVAGAMDLACHSLQRAKEAAWRCEASLLLLPPGVARRQGSVVLVSEGDAPGGLDAAIGIAAAAKERLLLLGARDRPADVTAALAARQGLRPEAIERRDLREQSPAAIDAALGRTQERLIVLPRQSARTAEEAAALAALRRVPVLLTEQPQD